MPEFFSTYAPQFIYAIISAIVLGVFKYICEKLKKSLEDINRLRNQELKEDIANSFKEDLKREIIRSTEADNHLQADINQLKAEVEILTAGILSVQKKMFMTECYNLLEKEEINNEDLAELMKDHEAYNALGGNHRGDELYNLVLEKFKNK